MRNGLTASLLALTLGALAQAQPLSYAGSRTTVNAGVLLIDSQRVGGQLYNRAPHVFYLMDRDNSVKPASISLNNPLGQTTLTDSMAIRWAANPNVNFPVVSLVGGRLGKADAPYWEVSLPDSSDDTLAKFDILTLTVAGRLSLNPRDREKLRKFIDQGGILWIDLVPNGGLAVEEINGAPIPFSIFNAGGNITANLVHPLLRTPNQMSYDDLVRMPFQTGLALAPATAASVTANQLFSGTEFESRTLQGIAGPTGGDSIAVARLGDGFFVATSQGISATLNRGRGPTGSQSILNNDGFRSLEPVIDTPYNAASKFFFNLLNLPSSSSMPASGSRKAGSTSVDVTAPALERFRDTPTGGFTPNHPPALFKGYLVAATSSGIVVYDPKPGQDLDGNGVADDGVVDPLGSDRDVIWASATAGGAPSAPIVVEVPYTAATNSQGAAAIDQIWVTLGNGSVQVFDLRLGDVLATIAPPGGVPVTGGGRLFSPVFQDGVVAVADTRTTGFGRVWLINPATLQVLDSGAGPWIIQGTSRLQDPSAEPAIGYIPIFDSSGGVDRVLYVASRPGINRPAGLTSLWLGAKGESPFSVRRSGAQIIIQTRAALSGLPVFVNPPAGMTQFGPKINLVRANGVPMTIGETTTFVQNSITQPGTNGELVLNLTAAGTGSMLDWDGMATPSDPTDDIGWRVDYHLDWGRVGANLIPGNNFVRGNVEFPDDNNFERFVIGAPAMTRQGHVVVVTSSPNPTRPGGTLFNMREEGRGDFVLASRYDLTDAFNFRLNGVASSLNYFETFQDTDPLVQDIPFLNQRITNLRFATAPAVQGDTIFAGAVGVKNIGFGNSPTSVIMSFKADPDPIEFIVTNLNEGGTSNNQITLVQPDYAKSSDKVTPQEFSVLPRSAFTVEPVPGSSNASKIIIKSLMANSNGQIRNSLSTSLPIILRGSASTDRVIEPEASTATGQVLPGNAAGKFSPLRWYSVLNGFSLTTGPVVTGETMYVGGGSVLPALIASGFTSIAFNGLMFGVATQISPTDTMLQSNPLRGWMQQLHTVKKNSPTPFDFVPNSNYKWPQFSGVQSIDDFRVRLLQAALPSQSTVVNLAAGDGSLAATGPDNLHAYTRSDFLVVDAGRVSRFDPSGNPLWTITQTRSAGQNNPSVASTTARQLSEPVRAYADGANSLWIVDSGANRVILTDRSGLEIRSVSGFKIHPSFVPPGYAPGAETVLNNPRDALVFTTTRTAAQVQAIFPGENLMDAATSELWRHILIADTGNRRLVEVVDRYRIDNSGRILGVVRYIDPRQPVDAGNPPVPVSALGVLFWHSPSELSGGQYTYNSIARTTWFNGTSNSTVVAFGFGTIQPGTSSVGLDTAPGATSRATGFGGVVIYDGPQSRVITQFIKSPIPAGSFLGRNGLGNYGFNLPVANQPATPTRISGLTSVTMRMRNFGSGPRLAVMITEATGVYELVQADPVGAPDTWGTSWMLPRDAYVGMRRPRGAVPVNGWTPTQLGDNPSGFRPMFARRLDSGDVLIANGYEGTRINGTSFNGEAVLIEGRSGNADIAGFLLGAPNIGFNSLSVKYELPPVQGVRDISQLIFVERQ